MRNITSEQAAWIAGVLEGEGCFGIYPRLPTRGMLTVIIITQKDPQILEYIRETTGIGRLRLDKRNLTQPTIISSGSIWRYCLTRRDDLVDFIRVIYPYLVNNRTRRKAWAVYKMAKLKGNYNQHRIIPLYNKEEREKIYSVWKTAQRKVG